MLVDEQDQLRLTGFEEARIEREGFREEVPPVVAAQHGLHVGRLAYRAPEILMRHTAFSFPVDCWSVGCTIWTMATRKPILFDERTEKHALATILGLLGGPDDHAFETLQSFPGWEPLIGSYKPFKEFARAYFDPEPAVVLGGLLDWLPSRPSGKTKDRVSDDTKVCFD